MDQIKTTQLKSLAQNLWNINTDQIQIQLKGLLEISTIKSLTIFPKDDKPISLADGPPSSRDIINTYPLYYERNGVKNHLGQLEIVSDMTPVINELESRVLIILATQGAKTFIVSLFILFLVNTLISHNLIKINRFAREISIDDMSKPLDLERRPNETRDEIDDLADSLNIMRKKIDFQLKENKKYQEQILQSQKMEALGTLASGIAHDFNNILQGLYNSLFIIEEEVIDNADALHHLNIAGNLLDRARELVKQILLYTKEEDIAFKHFSPIPPIQDVINILRAAKKRNPKINLFIDSPRGKVLGNQTQLKQVVLNLGNNALHAVENIKDPQITIRVDSLVINPTGADQIIEKSFLRIIVQDNGIGMSAELQKRIFEPFFTTKDINKGTGLGLSVVQGIVEKHGGKIELNSKENHGTQFTVYFPLHISDEEQNPALYSGKEKVLLVSKDPHIQEVLEAYAHRADTQYVICNDTESALETLKEERGPLICIIDQEVDGYSSEELIRKARQANKNIPILYLKEDNNLPPISLRVATLTRDKFLSLHHNLPKDSKKKRDSDFDQTFTSTIDSYLKLPSEVL